MKPFVRILEENFKINWKRSLESVIPYSSDAKVNTYNFNKCQYEPLRHKFVSITVEDENSLVVLWITQEPWHGGLEGMKKEIHRWATYWRDNYIRMYGEDSISEVIIRCNVEDREGTEQDSFFFYV